MNIKLTPLDHQFLSRMGAKVLPESVTVDDIAFGRYKLEVRRQFPRYFSEHIHAHALARVIHIHHGHVIAPIYAPSVTPNVPPVSVRPVEHHIHHSHAHRLTWWQIGLLIAVMILCSAVLARCQVDVIKIQDNTGALIKTFGGPFTFKAGANCTPSIAGSIFTFNCSGSAAASVSFFNTTTDRQGANLSFTSNTHTLWAVNFPNGITFSNIGSFSPTPDGTGLYDICLYDSSGNLKANEGAHHITGVLPEHYAITQTSVTLNAGTYYLGITGNATTANLRGGSTYAFTILGAVNSATPSIAGACAAVITMPTNAAQDTSNMPAVIFY